MIFPGVSVDKWLDKYPALKEGLPLCSCGTEHLRTYRSGKYAGIECENCKTAIWQCDKEKDNQHFLDLLCNEGSSSKKEDDKNNRTLKLTKYIKINKLFD